MMIFFQKKNMNFNAPEYQQLIDDRKSKLTLMSLEETLEVEPRCASNAVDEAEANAIPRRTRNPK